MADESCIDHVIRGKCRTRDVDWIVGELARSQHGVVARRQLLERGVSRRAIDVRLDRGSLHLVHAGVYAVGHDLLGVRGRWIAAVLTCGPSAVLSHRSAGQLLGIVASGAGPIEVTRRTSHRSVEGLLLHQASLVKDEVTKVEGIPVTGVSRTLFDLAGVVRRRELERALNEAEVRGLTDALSLPDLLKRYPRRRGSRALRELLQEKEPGGITRSEFEEMFVAFLDRYELPRPLLNATLALRGRFLQPDCLWRRERLIVELDGLEVHGTRRAFEEDRQRDRVLLVEGWHSMRITWQQLRDEPAAIAADLQRLLRCEGEPPTL